jgi:hypothetical protein
MPTWPQPIRLEYATAQDFSSGAAAARYSYARAKASNLAFAKSVKLHYRLDSAWLDLELPWLAGYGTYDVFGSVTPYTTEFVLSYTVNDVTYWDNNGSQNYIVPNFHSAVSGRVSHRSASLAAWDAFQRTVSGVIYIENVSYNKRVGIRLLPAGESTWLDVSAHYVGLATEESQVSLGPVERWEYGSPRLNTSSFTFAAYYENLDTGEWHWDNNFGQNYVISEEMPKIE